MYRPCIHRTGLLLTSAAALAACLGAMSSQGVAGAAATVQQKQVVLTNTSSGTTTVVTRGEEVVVKLSSPGFRWTEASVMSASPVAVLKKLSGHVSADGSSVTKFQVVGYGTASLEAIGNANVQGQHRRRRLHPNLHPLAGERHLSGGGPTAPVGRLSGPRALARGRADVAPTSGARCHRGPRLGAQPAAHQAHPPRRTWVNRNSPAWPKRRYLDDRYVEDRGI